MNPKSTLFVVLLLAVFLQQSIKLAAEFHEGQKSVSFSKVEGKVDHIWHNSKKTAFMNRRVVYTYEVNGKKYMSERETYPDRMNCAFAYLDGEKVDVYFDPVDPSECCLKKGIDDTETIWQAGLLVGVLVLGVSVLACLKEQSVA